MEDNRLNLVTFSISEPSLNQSQIKVESSCSLLCTDFVIVESRYADRSEIKIKKSGVEKIMKESPSYFSLSYNKKFFKQIQREIKHSKNDNQKKQLTIHDFNIENDYYAENFEDVDLLQFKLKNKENNNDIDDYFFYFINQEQQTTIFSKDIQDKQFKNIQQLKAVIIRDLIQACQFTSHRMLQATIQEEKKNKLKKEVQEDVKKNIFNNKDSKHVEDNDYLYPKHREYELQIGFKSHHQLLEEGINFKYSISQQYFDEMFLKLYSNAAIACVCGGYDKGKTFILNFLNNYLLGSGYNTITQCQGFVFGLQNLFIDLAGIHRAVDFNETYYKKLKKPLSYEMLRQLQLEKETVDGILMKISIYLSQLILIVVDVLTSTDQILITRIQDVVKTKKQSKSIIVIHNLKKFTDPLQILMNVYKNIGRAFNLLETNPEFDILKEYVDVFYCENQSQIQMNNNKLLKLFSNKKISPFIETYLLSINTNYEDTLKIINIMQQLSVYNNIYILNQIEDKNEIKVYPQEALEQTKLLKELKIILKLNDEQAEIDFFTNLTYFIYIKKFCVIQDGVNNLTHITVGQYDSNNSQLYFSKLFEKVYATLGLQSINNRLSNEIKISDYLVKKIQEEIKESLEHQKLQFVLQTKDIYTNTLMLKNPDSIKSILSSKNFKGGDFKLQAVKSIQYHLNPLKKEKEDEFEIWVAEPHVKNSGIMMTTTVEVFINSCIITQQRVVEQKKLKNVLYNTRTNWTQQLDIFKILNKDEEFASIQKVEQINSKDSGFYKFKLKLQKIRQES